VVELGFGPTFNHNSDFFSFTKLLLKLTSMIIPPFGAIRGGMRHKQFVESSGKVVQEWLPPTNFLPCFGLEVLFQSHILVTTNKIEPKKANYNHHHNHPQQHLLSSFSKVE
jgi:hypothetical protein